MRWADGRSRRWRSPRFPKDADRSVLATIFKGGLDKLAEAGVALLGGHTVQDTEIKFGYAVTGEVRTAAGLVKCRCAARRRAVPDEGARDRDHFDRAQVRARTSGADGGRRSRSMTTLNRPRPRRCSGCLPVPCTPAPT